MISLKIIEYRVHRKYEKGKSMWKKLPCHGEGICYVHSINISLLVLIMYSANPLRKSNKFMQGMGGRIVYLFVLVYDLITTMF